MKNWNFLLFTLLNGRRLHLFFILVFLCAQHGRWWIVQVVKSSEWTDYKLCNCSCYTCNFWVHRDITLSLTQQQVSTEKLQQLSFVSDSTTFLSFINFSSSPFVSAPPRSRLSLRRRRAEREGKLWNYKDFLSLFFFVPLFDHLHRCRLLLITRKDFVMNFVLNG